jgi:pyruvate/2-oxoglutarate dehydrogenase complex dihydrolipoamide acyltransferase (E2) component
VGEALEAGADVLVTIDADGQFDPAQIPATGRDGRITKDDVLEFLGGAGAGVAMPAGAAPRGKYAI